MGTGPIVPTGMRPESQGVAALVVRGPIVAGLCLRGVGRIDVIWVEQKQASFAPPSKDISFGEDSFSCRLIEGDGMFLPDCVRAPPLRSLDVVAIRCLQRSEGRKITSLKFMGGTRG